MTNEKWALRKRLESQGMVIFSFTLYPNLFFKLSMIRRPAILDEIMFYILERAKSEEDADKQVPWACSLLLQKGLSTGL